MSYLKGYHYTSLENWESIQKGGFIVPQPIKHPNLAKLVELDSFDGFWVYKSQQQGLSLRGLIQWNILYKFTRNVLELEIKYIEEECIKNGYILNLYHTLSNRCQGETEDFFFHKDEPATIITQEINLSRIKVIRIFNYESVEPTLHEAKLR